MKFQSGEKIVKGTVLFALADNLAAHSMGGFKVGVGFSLRKCRMCLATKEQVSKKVEFKLLLCLLQTCMLGLFASMSIIY